MATRGKYRLSVLAAIMNRWRTKIWPSLVIVGIITFLLANTTHLLIDSTIQQSPEKVVGTNAEHVDREIVRRNDKRGVKVARTGVTTKKEVHLEYPWSRALKGWEPPKWIAD